MTNSLRGVLVALATPFSTDGSLDEAALRALVDRTIEGGVDGVVACGSTAEFTSLTPDERRLVVETVIDQAAGRVPVIAQTGAQATGEAIDLSQHAEKAGASVLMVVAPYYEPLSIDETKRYLRSVAESVSIPVMLYNLPDATGVNMTPELIAELAREVENIKYVKDTTGDLGQAGKLIHHYGDLVSTFVGWDALALASFTEGAAGIMAGTANVFPAHLAAIRDAIAEGDLSRARSEWEVLYPVMDAIMSAPFVSAVKAALNATGFPAGDPRHPMLPLDAETTATITRLLAALPNVGGARP